MNLLILIQDTVEDAVQPTFPYLDSGIYELLSTLIWLGATVIVIAMLRKYLKEILESITVRIKSGAYLKIWNVEFGSIRINSSGPSKSSAISVVQNSSKESDREGIYDGFDRLFIVHRLFPSKIKGQLYDILIYVVGHDYGDLDTIDHVDYYFGKSWSHNVFTSQDRQKRFAILASAHGAGFLCYAEIFIKQNPKPIQTWRYIDFEMGAIGSS